MLVHHHRHLLALFTTNFTGYSRLLGEETSRNHKAYIERPPRHHNIIRNKGCEEVRLNKFSNYFNINSSTLFLKVEKLDKFVTDAGRQFQILGPCCLFFCAFCVFKRVDYFFLFVSVGLICSLSCLAIEVIVLLFPPKNVSLSNEEFLFRRL